jgi:hypothetical protein
VGVYTEYLDRNLGFADLAAERKVQLQRISQLRGGRDVLVYASDLGKVQAFVSIIYTDLLPINDQLANLKGEHLDFVLETPGGSGEVAEDIVRALRSRYQDVAVIVPGWAKSAGTIIAMSADEILMDATSGLGPIDAQILWQGKAFSADALLAGFKKIKEEVSETGVLNKAYIPILQGISPGELENAQNAQDFAKELVTKWLSQFKFKRWTKHASTGQSVTPEEKRKRAEEIATQLRDHSRWLTHGRSIKLDDLRRMRLQVSDYSENAELADAIRRYHTLLRMTFESNVYKVFETPVSQIYRYMLPVVQPGGSPEKPHALPRDARIARFDFKCERCGTVSHVQANLEAGQTVEKGAFPFPPDNRFRCPNCGTEHDLSDVRRQIELQAKKPVV